MKQKLYKPTYTISIIIFILSFGYYLVQSLLGFLNYINLLPFGFFKGKVMGLVYDFCFDELSVLPMLACFVLSIILGILLFAVFYGKFSSENLVVTACAPFALLIIYAVLMTASMVLGHIRFEGRYTSNSIYGISFALLLAYSIGFFISMHRERENLNL